MLAMTSAVPVPDGSGSAADDAVVVDRAAASATGAAADAAPSLPGSAGGVEAALPEPVAFVASSTVEDDAGAGITTGILNVRCAVTGVPRSTVTATPLACPSEPTSATPPSTASRRAAPKPDAVTEQAVPSVRSEIWRVARPCSATATVCRSARAAPPMSTPPVLGTGVLSHITTTSAPNAGPLPETTMVRGVVVAPAVPGSSNAPKPATSAAAANR